MPARRSWKDLARCEHLSEDERFDCLDAGYQCHHCEAMYCRHHWAEHMKQEHNR